MIVKKYDYSNVPYISKRDQAFISEDVCLEPFIQSWAQDLESFRPIIEKQKERDIDRQLISDELKKQYQQRELSTETEKNINSLLADNTFCIITAHQPSLLTGPLYFIFKICSILNLAKQLNRHYPEYHIVPLFISGGEDHDFEEINHCHIYSKTLEWKTNQTGPTGKMSLIGLEAVMTDLYEILGDSVEAKQLKRIVELGMQTSKNYADFSFCLVNELFKKYGLVYLNMDNPEMKRAFIPYMRKELVDRYSHKLITDTTVALAEKGFDSQAFPREINLFFMEKGLRERIIYDDFSKTFKVLKTKLAFTETEMLELLVEHPEKFSPNVVMRPIYQEAILPNIAYVGGGGEIAYWTERLSHFKYFDLPFPLLIRRNSAMIVDRKTLQQLDKTAFGFQDYFKSTMDLVNEFLKDHVEEDLDLTDESAAIEIQMKLVAEKAKAIQLPLEKFVLAENAKIQKQLQNIQKKLRKALKQENEIELSRIRKVKSRLFPNDSLQERYENFIPYYLKYGSAFIDNLIEVFDPLDRRFIVLEEGDGV